MGDGLVAVAEHAGDPEAELVVIGEEVDQFAGFGVGADDQDVADVAAVAPGGGEPRPVGAAADEEERQRGQRAHGDLAVEVTAAEPDVQHPRPDPRHRRRG